MRTIESLKSVVLTGVVIASNVAFAFIDDSDAKTTTIDVQSASESVDLYLNDKRALYTIIKTGPGKATLSSKYSDNKYFGGKYEIREGTLSAVAIPCYGKPTRVTVKDGATFDVSGATKGYMADKGTVLSIAGNGVNGAGAVTGVSINSSMFANLELTGNARIASTTAYMMVFYGYLSGVSRTYNLGDYVLEKTGAGPLAFWSGDMIATGNGGIKVSEGRLDLDYQNHDKLPIRLHGTSSNVLEVKGGATVVANALSYDTPVPWTMRFSGTGTATLSGTLNDSGITRTSYNRWAGPLEVEAPLEVRLTYTNNYETFCGPVETAKSLKLYGRGTLAFEGSDRKVFNGPVNMDDGVIEFNNTRSVYFGETNLISKGKIIFNDAGVVSNRFAYGLKCYSSKPENAPRLVITGNTIFPQTNISIGEESESETAVRYSVYEVSNGAVVSNSLSIGENGTQSAMAYINGGTWALPYYKGGNLKNRAFVGNASYGDLELADGLFRTSNGTFKFELGKYAKGEGTVAISGGTFESGTLDAGMAGYGCWYQTGGLSRITAPEDTVAARLGSGSISGAYYPPCAIMTVSGKDTLCQTIKGNYGAYVEGGSSNQSTVAMLNVRDGATLSYYKLYKVADAHRDSKFYLNLDGGVLKPGNCWMGIGLDDQETGKTTSIQLPDAVTLYGGGVVFDVSTALNGSGTPGDVLVDCELKAPVGGSITSITLPAEAKTIRYNHRPRVRIIGDGEGASAVAELDPKTGFLTGVTVTSPGFGYTQANTSCKVSRNTCLRNLADRVSDLNNWDCDITVGTIVSGGVTKRGARTALYLKGVNTYAGVSVCETGALWFVTAASHPAGSGLEAWRNARIILPGNVTAGSLSGQGVIEGGSVVGVTNVIVNASAMLEDGFTPLSVTGGSVAFADGAIVTVNGMRELIDAAGGVYNFLKTMKNRRIVSAAQGMSGSVPSVSMPGLTTEEASMFTVRMNSNGLRFSGNRGMIVILR